MIRRNADTFIAAAAGFIIIVLFTRHGGIGISPDSVVYSSAAENLRLHGRLIAFDNDPVAEFPPFYPFFLSSLMLLTGLNPILFAPLLNALLFAILIYLSGIIMNKFPIYSRWYRIALLTCIVASPCLLEIYSMLWTETVFLVLLLLFILTIYQYLQTHSRKVLIAAALLASIAAITRYAGLTLIATGGILIFLDAKLTFKRKLTNLGVYSILSISLLLLDFFRNYAVSGTLTGDREKSITSFIENMHDAGSVFSGWLPFLHADSRSTGWVTLCILIGLVIICFKTFLRFRRIDHLLGISAVFSCLYILFMIVSASLSRYERLTSRLLVPAFILLLWCGSYWILPALRMTRGWIKFCLMLIAAFIFSSFQYNQVKADLDTWDAVKDIGIPGYTEDDWKYSPTVQYIQKDSLPFRKEFTLYSDAYDAVYFFTRKPGKFIPHKEDKDEIQDFLSDRHCYLVWFNDGVNTDLVDLSFIIQTKQMKLVKEFDDGAIYSFGE